MFTHVEFEEVQVGYSEWQKMLKLYQRYERFIPPGTDCSMIAALMRYRGNRRVTFPTMQEVIDFFLAENPSLTADEAKDFADGAMYADDTGATASAWAWARMALVEKGEPKW